MNKKKLIIICFSLLLMFPLVTNATSFVPNVSIGNNFIAGEESTIDGNSIGHYIKAIYEYLSSIIGLVAAVALVIGGVMWLTAGGSSQRVSQAKSWISGSLTGLVLVLLSYLILQTINPNLVSFTSLDVKKIEPTEIGCCKYLTKSSGGEVAIDTSETECYQILTDPTKVQQTIATTTQKNIRENYEGRISSYIQSKVDGDNYIFDTDKNAKENTCQVLGYYFWWDKEDINGRRTITKAKNGEWSITNPPEVFGVGEIGVRFIEKDEFLNSEDAEVQRARNVWQEICSGVGDGGRCKNSIYYCYCYKAEPLVDRAKQNEPCGTTNAICIPEMQNGIELCDESDWTFWGGRGCEGSLTCCKKNSIKGDYDPSQP